MIVKPKSHDPLVRRSVGVLLLQQRASDKAIRESVDEQIADAAARAEKRSKEERDAVILAMLLGASKRMADDVAKTIADRRQASRAAARARLQAELNAVGIALAAHEWAVHSRQDEDDGYGAHAADSLAGQWRSLAVVALLGASRREKTPAQAIRSTSTAMRLRVLRTAETEVARAYSDEHSEALNDILEHDREYRDGQLADAIEARLGRQWSAMADACPTCWALDDVVVGIGEPFPGGLEPGFVHPRCRCVEVMVVREKAAAEAA